MTKHSGQFVSNDPRSGRKPVGAVSQRTKFINALKASSSSEEQFISKILTMAEDGNSTCLGIAATRLWKEPKATLPSFELPEAETKREHAENIINAMVAGELTADQASAAMAVLRGGSELTDVAELLEIVKELEGK